MILEVRSIKHLSERPLLIILFRQQTLKSFTAGFRKGRATISNRPISKINRVFEPFEGFFPCKAAKFFFGAENGFANPVLFFVSLFILETGLMPIQETNCVFFRCWCFHRYLPAKHGYATDF